MDEDVLSLRERRGEERGRERGEREREREWDAGSKVEVGESRKKLKDWEKGEKMKERLYPQEYHFHFYTLVRHTWV